MVLSSAGRILLSRIGRKYGKRGGLVLANAPRTMATTATAHWPLPARAVDHLLLDSTETTAAYWGGVALVVSGLFVTHLLPCVDYPQHLALADVLRRLWNPADPANATYQLNYFTYNGLFHIAVAAMSTVIPIELAGRLVVAASLLATAGAMVALVRVLRRPPMHAALFTPILFSFSVGWGFVNYAPRRRASTPRWPSTARS